MFDYPHLETLSAVQAQGTFEKAARSLGVTRSAISQKMKLLEDRWGAAIISRKPVKATKLGKDLCRHLENVRLLETKLQLEHGHLFNTENIDPVSVDLVYQKELLPTGFLDLLTSVSDQQNDFFIDTMALQDGSLKQLIHCGDIRMALATSWIESSKYRVSSLGSQELIAVASPDFSKTHFSQKREHQAFLEAPSLSHISNKTLNARFLAQVFGHSGEVSSNGLPTHHGIQNACREHKGWALLPSQLLTKDLSEGRLINLMQGHGLDVEVYFYVLISFDQIMPQVAVEIELLSRQFLQTFSPAQRTISPENQINR